MVADARRRSRSGTRGRLPVSCVGACVLSWVSVAITGNLRDGRGQCRCATNGPQPTQGGGKDPPWKGSESGRVSDDVPVRGAAGALPARPGLVAAGRVEAAPVHGHVDVAGGGVDRD